MNEELQEVLVEILNNVMTAKDFILSELPDVIQQLLAWKLYENAFRASLCVFFIAIIMVISRRCYNYLVEINDSTPFLAYVFGSVICMFPLMLGVGFFMDWLQIFIAPKVYLIEYAASLTK